MLTADATIDGAFDLAEAGGCVDSADDLDGDGTDDLVICGRGDRSEARAGGAVYVFHGPVEGALDTSMADAVFRGEANWMAGFAVEASADPTGDGLTDLVIGVPFNGGAGGVVVVAGGGL